MTKNDLWHILHRKWPNSNRDSPVCTEISDHFFNLQLFDLNEIYFTVNKFKLTLIYASFDSGHGI